MKSKREARKEANNEGEWGGGGKVITKNKDVAEEVALQPNCKNTRPRQEHPHHLSWYG